MDFAFELHTLGYTAAAMVLGGAIGFERELADKPAGMRTHMLVSGATALLVALGDKLVEHFAKYDGLIRADPVGLIAATVTGISFLGAGTIIRHGHERPVEGLTTAASLLFTAVVGICVAAHQLLLGAGATVLALVTLRTIRLIESRTKGQSRLPLRPGNHSQSDSPDQH